MGTMGMKDTWSALRWLTLIFYSGCLLPLCAQKVPVVEKNLPNGMRLLMVEHHDEPTQHRGDDQVGGRSHAGHEGQPKCRNPAGQEEAALRPEEDHRSSLHPYVVSFCHPAPKHAWKISSGNQQP